MHFNAIKQSAVNWSLPLAHRVRGWLVICTMCTVQEPCFSLMDSQSIVNRFTNLSLTNSSETVLATHIGSKTSVPCLKGM